MDSERSIEDSIPWLSSESGSERPPIPSESRLVWLSDVFAGRTDKGVGLSGVFRDILVPKTLEPRLAAADISDYRSTFAIANDPTAFHNKIAKTEIATNFGDFLTLGLALNISAMAKGCTPPDQKLSAEARITGKAGGSISFPLICPEEEETCLRPEEEEIDFIF